MSDSEGDSSRSKGVKRNFTDSKVIPYFTEMPENAVKWALTEHEALDIISDVGVLPLSLIPWNKNSDKNSPMEEELMYRRHGKAEVSQKRFPHIPVISTGARRKCCGKSRKKFSRSVEHFSRLSDEIILSIFKWLPKDSLANCARVCKRWKAICYDETLWTRVDLGKRTVPADVLRTVIERGAVVLRLSMSEFRTPTFIRCPCLIKNSIHRFSKLQYVDLSMASVSEEGLVQLFSICSQLKKVSLEHLNVNEDVISHLAENDNLEELNMSMCHGLNPSSITKVTLSCSKLQAWNLAWTGLSTECIQVLSSCMPSTVTRLNISGNRDTLSDKSLLEILKRCPGLTELDVSDCRMLTSVSIDHIEQHLKNLEHLHCSRCYNIPAEKYVCLWSLKRFQKLEVFGIWSSEAIEENLKEILPNIKINTEPFSTIARPTTGMKRTSIWGMRVRDCV